MKFRSAVIPSGNATAVEIPADVVKALGPEARPLVAIAVKGHAWRSRVALMRGRPLIGISAAQRAAAGIAEGEVVEVDLQRDDAPRVVPEPPDLAAAFNAAPGTRTAFEKLPFGLKRKHVTAIEDAKTAQVRKRRIETFVASLNAVKGAPLRSRSASGERKRSPGKSMTSRGSI